MDIVSLQQAATSKLAQGQYEQCHQLCLQILKIDSRHPEAHFLLAINSLSRKQVGKAIVLLQVATQLQPNNGRYWTQLARAYSQADKVMDCQQALERALVLAPVDAMSVDTIGVLLSRLGDHAKAENYFKLSLQRQPHNPDYLFNLATSLRVNGKLTEARKLYLKLFELQPDRYEIYPALAELASADQCVNMLTQFELTLKTLQDDINGQLQISHGIARLQERLNNHHKALEVLKQSNHIKRQSLNYSINNDQLLFDTIKAICGPHFCQNGSDCSSFRPIFIVGMPRSGTTLLERIISSHSNVFAAGELQDFATNFKRQSGSKSPQILDPNTLVAAKQINFTELGQQYLSLTQSRSGNKHYFIDKMPLNFLYAGFINKALPNAKIICLRRNPMDTVLSNFRQLFATHFSYYNYAYDLEDIARYYLLFDNLVAHWRTVLPPTQFCEIHYEAIVENTEQQSRKIIDFLNLSWEEQCLEFHHNATPVATASAVQVRQPIYQTSVGRWQAVQQQLAPAITIFNQQGIKY